ncbi:hypothetical protein IXO1088_017805 [Xanthomonas oryzae pv. oryzae]|nr:hypothetical protein IXO1088_017805 [Xanthomonas oryzae pv. oryzae]
MPPHSEQIVSRICGVLFRGSLTESRLLPPDSVDNFIQLLEYADSRIEIALKHFYKYLAAARH